MDLWQYMMAWPLAKNWLCRCLAICESVNDLEWRENDYLNRHSIDRPSVLINLIVQALKGDLLAQISAWVVALRFQVPPAKWNYGSQAHIMSNWRFTLPPYSRSTVTFTVLIDSIGLKCDMTCIDHSKMNWLHAGFTALKHYCHWPPYRKHRWVTDSVSRGPKLIPAGSTESVP